MSRKGQNIIFTGLAYGAVGLSGGVLFFLFGVIMYKGIAALDLEFLIARSRNFGARGGIFYQIIGSLLLVGGAALITTPLALGTGIFKSELLKHPFWQKVSDMLIYGLNGVPSIIFGIFGLIFFVNFVGTGISWGVGAIILAFMILPTVVLTTYQSMDSIPDIYRETALSLGYRKWQVITKVLVPQGIQGTVTGLLLGLARAVGETAPIMFIATAYSGAGVPSSVFDPVMALPTHILALAQQATDSQALQNAWGTSFVLISLVLIFSLSALYSRVQLKTISQR